MKYYRCKDKLPELHKKTFGDSSGMCLIWRDEFAPGLPKIAFLKKNKKGAILIWEIMNRGFMPSYPGLLDSIDRGFAIDYHNSNDPITINLLMENNDQWVPIDFPEDRFKESITEIKWK